jgi:hypothetical protein|nr:MAG TPA: hypothetical protein [Caudoviricetes sp.]
MKKITLSEFFKNDEKLAIHCDTEEKANLLLKAFDKMGKRWRSNQSYLEENNWRGFKEETCYENDGTYCCKGFYPGTSYIVYEFEEVILEDGNYMNENVKKVFEMLGVKPNEKFNVMSKGKVDSEILRIDTRLRVLTDTSNIVAEALRYLLTGEWQIVKLQPKKKKLRDWTMEDFKKWEDVNCKGVCDDCPFTNVHCNDNAKRFWMNHKDLFSDKFLDQEVEVPE